MASILRDEPTPIGEIEPRHPARLSRLVRRCVNKDPERRYQTALDVRNELEELAEDLSSGVLEAPALPTEDVSSRPSRRRTWLLGAAFVALAGISGYWLLERFSRPSPPPEVVSFEQITDEPARELFPSLSPDGQFVAYASPAEGNWDIYLLRVGGQNAINLTAESVDDDWHPSFSPDGRSIAFASGRDGGGIFIMGATGESVRRVADGGFHPDWSPDGKQIVYSTGEPIRTHRGRGVHGSLHIVDLATGEDRLLTEGDGDAVQPSWSPKGDRIAFWGFPAPDRAIYTIPVGGGAAVKVLDDPFLDWSPVWAPDGRWLYFSSDRGGSMNLWRIEIDPQTGAARGDPDAVTTSTGAEVWHATFSADGNLGAYSAYQERQNIQRTRLSPGAKSAGESTWFTEDTRRASHPDISVDGRVAYEFGVNYDIVISDLDGSNRINLTQDKERDRWPRWSPNGERLAFFSLRSGSAQIWTIDRDGTNLQQVTHGEGTNMLRPVWSPDGSKIAFSGDFDDDYRRYIVDLTATQSEDRIVEFDLDEGMTFFQSHSWSPDGSRLAGIGAWGDGEFFVTTYSLSEQTFNAEARFAGLASGPWKYVRWLSDSRTLVFSEGSSIEAVDAETGERWPLLSTATDYILGFGVAPDDSEIFLGRHIRRADLWLMRFEREEG
jgi:Tol biopolymer transport system component